MNTLSLMLNVQEAFLMCNLAEKQVPSQPLCLGRASAGGEGLWIPGGTSFHLRPTQGSGKVTSDLPFASAQGHITPSSRESVQDKAPGSSKNPSLRSPETWSQTELAIDGQGVCGAFRLVVSTVSNLGHGMWEQTVGHSSAYCLLILFHQSTAVLIMNKMNAGTWMAYS